jgi:hypothetical protein
LGEWGIKQFHCGHADMVGGALMDSGNGGFGKNGVRDTGDFQMVIDGKLHIVSVDSLQMTASNDCGSQGQGGSIEKEIGQVVLSCQNDGKTELGIAFELGDGVELLRRPPSRRVNAMPRR